MTEIKLALCREFVKMVFAKHKCVERNLFFKMAEEVGLYAPNTFGTEISQVLSEMITVETISDEDGIFLYNAFHLKDE